MATRRMACGQISSFGGAAATAITGCDDGRTIAGTGIAGRLRIAAP